MNKKSVISIAIFLFIYLTLSLFARTAKYPIRWNPTRIKQTIGLGDAKSFIVTFSSKTRLQNVDLWVVSELQPFLSLDKNHFETVAANITYEVKICIYIPHGTEKRLYDGTIHLRVGSKTYPRTLKIELNIVDVAKIIGSEGDSIITTDGKVTIEIPPGALPQDTLITIISTGEEGIGGEIYDIGPSGLDFFQPPTVIYCYNPYLLPIDVNEENLFLASINDHLEILGDIQLDIVNKKIFGKISHFSNIGPGAYKSTAVHIDDFDVATSFRMPIGDIERLQQTPPLCGPYPSAEDLGENLDPLKLGPPITFNDGALNNEWYVSVGFIELYFLGWHPGEDWNDQQGRDSDLGSPIHAIADGIVLYSNNEGSGFGNILVLGHKLNSGKIIASVYAHMHYLSPCGIGSVVKKGDVIGLIGKSGETQYAHLHFEITNENYPYIRVDNNGYIELPTLKNKGWHWPGNDKKFIEDYYYPPSSFIKFFSVNKVLNPSFEEGSGTWPDGWEVPWPSGANFIWDDTVAHTGSRSVGITNPIETQREYAWVTTDYISVDPSKDYELSFWYFWTDTPASGEDAGILFRLFDADGNELPGGFGPIAGHEVGSWQYLTYKADLFHPETVKIKIRLRRISFGSINFNAIIWFDDIRFIQELPVNPIVSVSPGSGPAGTQFLLEWSGFTPNSTLTSHLKKPDGTWLPTRTFNTNSQGNASHTIDSTSFAEGTYEHGAVDDCSGRISDFVSFTITEVSAANPPDIPTFIAPPNNVWINYDPVFKAQVSDPDGGMVRAQFHVIGYGTYAGTWVESGGISEWGPVSAEALIEACPENGNKGACRWRAYAEDDTGLKSGWYGYWVVKVDKGAPDSSIIQGRVTNRYTGQPIAGAKVTVLGQSTAPSFTDANGFYTLTGNQVVTLTPWLLFQGQGYFSVTRNLTLGTSLPVTLDVTLLPGGTILQGYVRNLVTGAPIAGANVIITTSDAVPVPVEITTTTDANGFYSFDSFIVMESAADGFQVSAIASAPGYLMSSPIGLSITPPLPGTLNIGLISGAAANPPDIPTFIAPPNNVWINYDPVFKAQVSDADGGMVRAQFHVIGYGTYAGTWVESGGVSEWGPVNLGDYAQYRWRAYAEDDTGLKSGWYGYWVVKVDK